LPLDKPYENENQIKNISDILSLKYENTHKVNPSSKDFNQHIQKNFETYKTLQNDSEFIQ